MNQRKGNRRRSGGMRFKPSTGVGPKNKKAQKAAAVARAEAIENVTSDDEAVFDESRHSREIQRSENLAAGLPPDISDEAIKEREEQKSADSQATPSKAKRGGQGNRRGRKGRNREPEKPFEPVEVPDQPPQGIVETIKAATDKVIERVKRVFIPLSKSHKELIINAEPLESRVAVLEEGTLEEFTIERNEEHRLVGSIYKGVVKNLEDGLKAAFVDIGFEKNAFLHYWDIVPNNFDSNIEIVERKKGRKQKPKITQKDIPRLYPAGSEIVVQVTKGPIGTKGPRITTNLAIPGRFLVLLPTSDQSGVSQDR